MKRLLMFVGVAVIAAAMYVAASPASQQGGFASQKEVSALKKQVASLSKSLKSTKKESDAVAGFLGDCFLSTNAGVWPRSCASTSMRRSEAPAEASAEAGQLRAQAQLSLLQGGRS